MASSTRIQRFYQSGALEVGQSCALDTRNHHYLSRVLRAREGVPLVLFNGDGFDYSATLELCDKRHARVHVDSQLPGTSESQLHIHLLQGVSRGERMDFSLQKAVELGVQEITPLISERTNVKLSGDRLDKKMSHWHGVIISACEQSGRARIPVLKKPETLDALNTGTTLGVMLDPHSDLSFAQLADNTNPPKHVTLAIGPEGGFSELERQTWQAHHFNAVRLGPRILRTETAGLASIAILQSLWGDLG